jgi:hypothetical protein
MSQAVNPTTSIEKLAGGSCSFALAGGRQNRWLAGVALSGDMDMLLG